MFRKSLKTAGRIVVKLGTGVLTDANKHPDPVQMKQLVAQMARLRRDGREVVVVTSGAVGAGMGVLGWDKRPGELAAQQACAAVGQCRIMATYEKLFAEFGLHVGQVLVTHEDVRHHERHLNARNTLVTLLKHGVVPIINENDAVSFTELKFGDNDKLSALVACLLPADLLVLLTTVDGMFEHYGTPDARILDVVEKIDAATEKMAGGTASQTAVGGMSSKLKAGKIAVRAGIPMVIASGRKTGVLPDILAGKSEGTLFVARSHKLPSRKRWIAFFHAPKGTLYVDDGCKKALRDQGRSLLRPGIVRMEGAFAGNEVVSVCDTNGTEFARGIAGAGADAITAGKLSGSVVIHRDNLVVL